MPYLAFIINRQKRQAPRKHLILNNYLIIYLIILSITNTVFVNSELNFNYEDQKISNESNTNNYSGWDTSDSSSDNDDDAKEVYDK